MSVNSVAVLRLMGKGVGGAAPAGVVRGRGATRGGRGKKLKLHPRHQLEKKKVLQIKHSTDSAEVHSTINPQPLVLKLT